MKIGYGKDFCRAKKSPECIKRGNGDSIKMNDQKKKKKASAG